MGLQNRDIKHVEKLVQDYLTEAEHAMKRHMGELQRRPSSLPNFEDGQCQVNQLPEVPEVPEHHKHSLANQQIKSRSIEEKEVEQELRDALRAIPGTPRNTQDQEKF